MMFDPSMPKFMSMTMRLSRALQGGRTYGELDKFDTHDVLAKMTDTRLFIFDQQPIPENLEMQTFPTDVSLPFPVCGFEVKNTIVGRVLDGRVTNHVVNMVVFELSPFHYRYYLLGLQSAEDAAAGHFIVSKFDEGISDSNSPDDYPITRLMTAYLRAMKTQTIATEKVNLRFKYRDSQGVKQTAKISEVCHVYPKKAASMGRGPFGGRLDFTHRWEVIGHWRTYQGLGKDREGIRRQEGYTWVKAHVKGPEHAPLVPKVRAIHN